MYYADQLDIEVELPLISYDDAVGYDFELLAKAAMTQYRLDPDFGVGVDYWANSL